MINRLPEQFRDRMKELLGEEYPDFESAYNTSARKSLRICELKTTSEQFKEQAPFLREPVPWVKNGFYYDHTAAVSGHPFYRAGVFYITEASAMTPVECFPVRPGERVLDLCAAPGGKSFALAGRLGDTGLLISNEVSASRAKILLYNMESLGIRHLCVVNEQAHRLAEKFPSYFDKILVDAPCSGEGMFRKDQRAADEWSLQKVRQLAALQKELLGFAVTMLRPGGMLMYSTCTFSPEENEQNAAWLLENYPEMTIEEIPGYEGFDSGRPEWAGGETRVSRAVRIWPHRMEAEGQFFALFSKSAGGAEENGTARVRVKKKKAGKSGNERLTREQKEMFRGFAGCMTIDFPEETLKVIRDGLYCVPEEIPDLSGLRVMRYGLYLGEFKKDRFEPSQSLAFALSGNSYRYALDLNPGDERLRAYLGGEEIRVYSEKLTVKKGWILVCSEGYSLGFGKLSGGVLKNKLLYSRRL